MLKLVIIGTIILFLFSLYYPTMRYIYSHPFYVIGWGFYDIFTYFKYKKWNVAPTGKLYCYCAHFGGGKTLSSVRDCNNFFKKYNDKKVFINGEWVIQKVFIHSNIELKDCTYIPLKNMDIFKDIACIEVPSGYRFVHVIFCDEASTCLNSRQFKSNLSPAVINPLLQSRHININFWYNSQKFSMTDALIRGVTQKVIDCKKVWRFVLLNEYNADAVENCSDIRTLKPLAKRVYFANNKLFNSYSTLEMVKQFAQDDTFEPNDIILNSLDRHDSDISEFELKRKFKRRKHA